MKNRHQTKEKAINDYDQLKHKDINLEIGTIGKEDLKNLLWQKDFQAQRTILDNLIEHVVIHDMELKVLWANKSACISVELELEQVVSRFCYEIWAKRSIPCEDCPVSRSRRTGTPQSIEKRTPDGRCWQISASPMFDTDGQITAMVELTLDVTKRVQAEEDLKRIQIDQEHLIKKRTHDLIRLNEKLKKEIEDRKKTEMILRRQKDYIHQLAMELSKAEDRERQRIAELLHGDLQQMLAYLKLKFHKLKISETEVNKEDIDTISDHIDNCIERCRNLSHELKPFVLQNKNFISALEWVCRHMKEHYELDVSLQATDVLEIPSPVLSSLLIRSIREILFNVVKHSGGKKAFIQVHAEDRQLLITTKDNGIGCDPDVLRAKRANNSAFGLSDIEDRVSFLGGYMDVETAPGRGFSVKLWVPKDACSPIKLGRPVPHVSAIPEIMAQRATSDPPVLSEKAPIRVLLADDHTLMRNGLAELISGHADIEVVGMAANGEEAVELAVKLRPEVILMDISMPVMNGIDATHQIKGLFPEINIIGLTMHKGPDIHQALEKAGACACLLKSGSLENLVETVRSFSIKKD